MSEVTVVLNNGQQAIVNYDTRKIFVRENRYASAQITNGGLVDLVITPGMVLGRIGATQKVAILKSAAVDGSQFPVGVAAQDITLAPAASTELAFCIGGDVVEDKLIFDGSDDLDTLVSLRSLRDRLAGDTLGIKVVPSTEMTAYDNQ